MEIRFIKPSDNAALAQVIRTVLVDLGVPKVGTAYADKALDSMYENYIPTLLKGLLFINPLFQN